MKLSVINEVFNRRDLLKRLFGQKPAEPEQPAQPVKPVRAPGELAGIEPPPEPAERVGMDRRDFLHKTGAAAMTTAIPHSKLLRGVSSLMAAKGIVDAFSSMTDEQLLNTPEQKWLDKISPERRARIAAEHPEHGTREAVSKLVKILSYSVLTNSGLPGPAASLASNTAADATRALNLIGKNWKLNQSDIIKNFTSYGYAESKEYTKEFVDFLRKNANKYGIKMDLDAKKGAHDVDKELGIFDVDYDEDAAIRNWESEGGSFESKLARALALLS